MAINRENYITIQGWMVTDLKLKGNSLLIYAIIYGFSQEENQRFNGSRQYLAEWTNGTQRGVQKALNALVESGLLDKKESIVNGVKLCSYRANRVPQGREQSSQGVGNKVPQGRELSSQGVANKVPQGREQSSHNNIDNNISDISNNNMSDKPTPRTRFVKPTLAEVAAYCAQRKNKVDPEKFLDYYESNGWKVGRNPMKDWKAAVRSWERNTYGASQPKRGTGAHWNDLDGIL